MSPLNHKRTTSSLAPSIFWVAKNWQIKDRRLPIVKSVRKNVLHKTYSCCLSNNTLNLSDKKRKEKNMQHFVDLEELTTK
jgi:hypothetical protein